MMNKIYPHTGDMQIVYLNAVVIGKRFSSDMIEQIQALKWWDWSVDKIREFLPYLMNGDLEKIVAMKNR